MQSSPKKLGVRILNKFMVLGIVAIFQLSQTIYIVPPAFAAYSDPSSTICDGATCVSKYHPSVWTQGTISSFQPRPVSSTKYFFAGAISDVTSSGSVFGFESASTSPVTFYLGGHDRYSTYSPAYNGGYGSYCWSSHLFALVGGAASVATQDEAIAVAGGASSMFISGGWSQQGGDSSSEPGQGISHGRDGGYNCQSGGPGGIQNATGGSGFVSNPDNLNDLQSCGCSPPLGPFYSGAWAAVYPDIELNLNVSRLTGRSVTFTIAHNSKLDISKMDNWRVEITNLDTGVSLSSDYEPSADHGTIEDLETGTNYSFGLNAMVNNTRTFTASAQLLLKDKPEPVTDLFASPDFTDYPNLSWASPNSNGDPITSYRVEEKGPRDTTFKNISIAEGNQINLEPTDPDSTYTYRVFASNKFGESNLGTEITYRSASAPSAPTSVVFSKTLTTQPHISWNPSTQTGKSLISYAIEISEDNKTWIEDSHTFNTNTAPTHLEQGKSYFIRICGQNIYGSNCSNPIFFPTALVPDQIASVSVQKNKVNSATLAWLAPEPNGANVTSYIVESKTTNSASWTHVLSTPSLTATISDLPYNVPLTFRVIAVNIVGASNPSPASTAITVSKSSPTSPLDFKVVNVSKSEIGFSWHDPANTGGYPLTSFTVSLLCRTNLYTKELPINVHTISFSQLKTGIPCVAQIFASNKLGKSSPSSIKRTIPNPPVTNILIEPISGLLIPYQGKISQFQTSSRLLTNGMDFTGNLAGKLYFGNAVIGNIQIIKSDHDTYLIRWIDRKKGIAFPGRYKLQVTSTKGEESFTKWIEFQVKLAPKPPAPKQRLVVSMSFSSYFAHIASYQDITLYVNVYPAVSVTCHFYSGNENLGTVRTGSIGAYTTIPARTFLNDFVYGLNQVAISVDCSNSRYEGSDYDYLYLTR